MRPTPPGFNKADVVKGLHTAMQFGAPNSAEDRATFCWAQRTAAAGEDEAGVPFSPNGRSGRTIQRVSVPCAVEYGDAAATAGRMGGVDRTKITVTLLDPDWAKVRDFEYVVWGGDKYLRRRHQVVALGSLDVHTLICAAEDES